MSETKFSRTSALNQYDVPENDDSEFESGARKKYYVCNEHGHVLKIVKNKFPGGAAKKGANIGLKLILVYCPLKDKWYPYSGSREEIPAHLLTEHQKKFGIRNKTRVERMRFDPNVDYALPKYPRKIDNISPVSTPTKCRVGTGIVGSPSRRGKDFNIPY